MPDSGLQSPSPCFAPAKPEPLRRCDLRQCSLSIVALVLAPTVGVMVAVALIAWFMIHGTAANAMDVIAHQGQQCFLQATRDSILSYTAAVQRVHSVNLPKWLNTTCDGSSTAPNVSAFAEYDDIRLALWSQLYFVTEGLSLVAAGFPHGAALAYMRSAQGLKWVPVDQSTNYWMHLIQSNRWQAGWDNGTDSWTKGANGAALNMSQRVWYTDGAKNGRQSWSAIYYSLAQGGLSLPAVMPVYHPNGELKLVADAEVSVQQLDSFLTALKMTANTFAFVAELDGSLVASTPEGLATAVPAEQSATGAAKVRVAAQQAGDERIVAAAKWVVTKYGSFAGVPAADTNSIVTLAANDHFLFTGHVTDEFGLHWVIVIGLPRSDMLQDLDQTTIRSILIIMAVLLASMLLIGAVAISVRRNLQLFARRINLMGTMDLEGAKQLEGVIFLSEARLILVNLRETIENLSQFRTFLPQVMLNKVWQAEDVDDVEEDLEDPRSLESHKLRNSLTGLQHPARIVDESMNGSLASSVSSWRNHSVISPAALHASASAAPRVHQLLDRRMDWLPVTLLCVALPQLRRAQRELWAASDFMLWYETCLSTTLAVLQKWKGDFYRLMGDHLLCSWGAMRRVAAQSAKACQAAWQLSQALRELDAQGTMAVKYQPQISVVTGTAMCGVMGTQTNRDMYLVGPLVGQGAHLASLNALYGTHMLVDSAVAKQCEILFSLQVCGFVRSTSAAKPIQPVFELVSPTPEGADGKLGNQEWLYRLAPTDGKSSAYQIAMEDIKHGLLEQARQGLKSFLNDVPDHPHAKRILQRITGSKIEAEEMDDLID